ncbi:phage tail assembly protein [Escherichia coli]|uniref:phage tail assembly protein n=1 Tax=Escherichia coli TaxID=562 RepID=UPI003528DDD9
MFIRNDPARPTQTGELVGMLAKVPQSSVDQMSPADLNAAAWLVAGFFLQA